MDRSRTHPQGDARNGVPASLVDAAAAGDRAALDRVIRGIEPLIARLALRFFGCPRHAEDATQEALIQIAQKLDRFDGKSELSTWAYRVATNRFLSMARSRAERAALTFEAFDEELTQPAGEAAPPAIDLDDALLISEVRIGCTLAMLLCLDRESRLAYILGAIVELDHETAADILDCAPATYRKRLERARDSITSLMRARCGVFDEKNRCRCRDRIPIALRRGRLDPKSLVFAPAREQARRFPAVLERIRALEAVQRTAAIYQSHPDPEARVELAASVAAAAENDALAIKDDR